jgi:fructose 1,6-bisphosphatase
MSITLSVIKADVGGYVGHSESHPDVAKKLVGRFVDLD